MKIDITKQIETDASFPIDPVRVLTGSALTVEVTGVPRLRGNCYVTGVTVSVTNADAVTIPATCEEYNDFSWRCTFAASNFANYGLVENGIAVTLVLSDGAEIPTVHAEKIGLGIFEVVKSTPTAQPGDPTKFYQVKGDEEYHKSYILDGVQHFKKVTISYNAEMADWGFNLEGDYILNSQGEFVPFI